MSFTRTLSNQAGLHHNYVIEAVILHVTHMGRRGLNRQGLGRFHREPKMYPYAASEFLYKLNMLESTFSRFSIRTHTPFSNTGMANTKPLISCGTTRASKNEQEEVALVVAQQPAVFLCSLCKDWLYYTEVDYKAL